MELIEKSDKRRICALLFYFPVTIHTVVVQYNGVWGWTEGRKRERDDFWNRMETTLSPYIYIYSLVEKERDTMEKERGWRSWYVYWLLIKRENRLAHCLTFKWCRRYLDAGFYGLPKTAARYDEKAAWWCVATSVMVQASNRSTMQSANKSPFVCEPPFQ